MIFRFFPDLHWNVQQSSATTDKICMQADTDQNVEFSLSSISREYGKMLLWIIAYSYSFGIYIVQSQSKHGIFCMNRLLHTRLVSWYPKPPLWITWFFKCWRSTPFRKNNYLHCIIWFYSATPFPSEIGAA